MSLKIDIIFICYTFKYHFLILIDQPFLLKNILNQHQGPSPFDPCLRGDMCPSNDHHLNTQYSSSSSCLELLNTFYFFLGLELPAANFKIGIKKYDFRLFNAQNLDFDYFLTLIVILFLIIISIFQINVYFSTFCSW